MQKETIARPSNPNPPRQQLIPVAVSPQHRQPPVVRVEKAEQLIRDAERNRARVHEVPGNYVNNYEIVNNDQAIGQQSTSTVAAVKLDEDYLLVGSFLDENLRQRIGNGEYIDFAKLMPKEKNFSDEDVRM